MATLHTAFSKIQQSPSSPALRAWLGDDWAILFSHPDDFVRCDLEMDRWLVLARDAFAKRQIRPLALNTPTLGDRHGWVDQVSGDERTVLLEDPRQQHFGPVDLQAPVLREQIEQCPGRFVMVIDNALRVQKKLSYDTLVGLPSPFELLGWADALRAKQGARQPARTDGGRRLTSSHQPHPCFAARRHKHPVPQVACAHPSHIFAAV